MIEDLASLIDRLTRAVDDNAAVREIGGDSQILQGDCREVMATMAEASVDAIVTDPPYGLGFMGKQWDTPGAMVERRAAKGNKWDHVGGNHNPSNSADAARTARVEGRKFQIWCETWANEALRVLKPGGHLLAFGGTRTYHRMVCAIEDAGFEVRDQLGWLYGSGFPKSHNLDGDWQGWGTALKPAWEPIVVARKPLRGTVTANVARYGTGALNIDGCRVPTSDDLNGGAYAAQGQREVSVSLNPSGMNVTGKTVGREFVQPTGRWPANLIHDGSDEVLAAFPDAPGQLADARSDDGKGKFGNVYSPMRYGRNGEASADSDNKGSVGFKMKPGARRGDSGSAARFFYCAKANRTDRGEGNTHPTVKPTDLMRWLCRLVTPPGGLILDPFMGSGSTLKAAKLEGFNVVGIELNSEYIRIACRRIAA